MKTSALRNGGAVMMCVLALFGCDGQVSRGDFCEMAARQPLLSQGVRFDAHLFVTDHGSVLIDQECPSLAIVWEESEHFRGTAEFDDFGRMAREIVAGFDGQDRFGISVDVEGELRARPNSAPVLQVTRLYRFEKEEHSAALLEQLSRGP